MHPLKSSNSDSILIHLKNTNISTLGFRFLRIQHKQTFPVYSKKWLVSNGPSNAHVRRICLSVYCEQTNRSRVLPKVANIISIHQHLTFPCRRFKFLHLKCLAAPAPKLTTTGSCQSFFDWTEQMSAMRRQETSCRSRFRSSGS